MSAARLSLQMPYRGTRLLLYVLVNGLGRAVRGHDDGAVVRYRGRLHLLAEQFDANPPIRDILQKLLAASSLWLASDVIERYGTTKQILELIERVGKLIR